MTNVMVIRMMRRMRVMITVSMQFIQFNSQLKQTTL